MNVNLDRKFDEVVPGSGARWECSPDIARQRDFQGIRVTAPARVRYQPGKQDFWGGFARITLCGAYRVDEDFLDRNEGATPLLIAVDARTHEAWAGRYAVERAAPARRAGRRAPSPGDARTVQSRCVWTLYFNANLASVLDLPARDADYLAYATLEQYVSNVVRIEVRREGTPGAHR